ncbi:MAG: squalene--hopene cyclase, partial [Janthinobacterium lividum]
MNDTTQPEEQAIADTLRRVGAASPAPEPRAVLPLPPPLRTLLDTPLPVAPPPDAFAEPDAAPLAALEAAVEAGTRNLIDAQRPDGHWLYELEADATIPAEYVLLVHHLAEQPDLALEAKIAVYLRRIQGAHGGWPLFHDGPLDISASVKAYFALKMIGDSIDAPHMRRAREAILAH